MASDNISVQRMKECIRVTRVAVHVAVICKHKESNLCCILYHQNIKSSEFEEYERKTGNIQPYPFPQFLDPFELDYFFEESQNLKFQVYSVVNDTNMTLKGEVSCTLKEICIQKHINKKLMHQNKEVGELLLTSYEVGDCLDEAILHFKGEKLPKMDTFGSADPYLLFYRRIETMEGRHFVPVCKTNTVKGNRNPDWNMIQIRVETLCGNKYNNPIKIECWDWDPDWLGKHDFIGDVITDLSHIKTHDSNFKFELRKGDKVRGKVISVSSQVMNKPTFYDYMCGDKPTRITFAIAIDFTESNGKADDPNSMHYIGTGTKGNIYQQLLSADSSLFQEYGRGTSVLALGFGAKPSPGDLTSFCFPLIKGKEYIDDIGEVQKAYTDVVRKVELSGPTKYADVINYVTSIAGQRVDGSQYIVLVMMTDDYPEDIKETKAALSEAGKLPMSVILLCVGDKDFSEMKKYVKIAADRDVVKIVRVEDFRRDGQFISLTRFMQEVRREIPGQIISWMTKYRQQKTLTPNANRDVASLASPILASPIATTEVDDSLSSIASPIPATPDAITDVDDSMSSMASPIACSDPNSINKESNL